MAITHEQRETIYATSGAVTLRYIAELEADAKTLDWLQDQIVDVIYLDDGRIIDVRGLNLRQAILNAMAKARTSETTECNESLSAVDVLQIVEGGGYARAKEALAQPEDPV